MTTITRAEAKRLIAIIETRKQEAMVGRWKPVHIRKPEADAIIAALRELDRLLAKP